MAVNINLIKNRHTLSEREYKQERMYLKYATMGLVVVVVVTLAISIWQFVLTRTLNKVETEISNSTGQLQNLSEASAMQIYLKSRLKLITSFLEGRSISRQALQKVFSINIPGVTVAGATFESENVIHIQAKATNVLVFSQLVDYVSQNNDFFIQVVSQSVNRAEDGTYQMDLLLTLPTS